ncbi:disulfide bond formation protein DsbA [Nocardioides albidus]|uniref:Disulfide bond formation protein DsbA n=1 Tax=Nocardioides albidus TaxID=1517589 RepID=A0A5C4VNM7_9ACTN|nr:thioredoxin domain-containing protein [Nocardioides albidus]TNM37513.1 disulfide bond formation protein DsbA [Nocardioides albidus]
MSSNSRADARAKAAEMRAAQQRSETRRRFLTIGGVLAVMALIVGGSIWFGLREQDKGEEKLADAASSSSEYGVAIGDADAPRTVVIYEDFLCPYCGELERATRDDLTALAADGKVRVEYRPFDLLSRIADYPIRATNAFALVLEKSGPEVAKKFHDLLYENQPSEEDPDAATNDDLVDLAVEAGAAEADVRGGIESLSHQAWVDEATAEAAKAGVTGTPTVLLDGEVFQDGRTIDELADNLISELE